MGSDDMSVARTPFGNVVSTNQHEMWSVYTDIFARRWRIDALTAEHIAIVGGVMFEAEYAEHGNFAYAQSVALPVRNAYYQMYMLERRWHNLREMGVMAPVLDYGCGVGLLAVWLRRQGRDPVYGYELPGVQRDIMREAFATNDVREYTDWCDVKFNTVLCLNVLEHVEHPFALLQRLYTLGNRVIADVCIDNVGEEQTPHIAPRDELHACAQLLAQKRTAWRWEPTRKWMDRVVTAEA